MGDSNKIDIQITLQIKSVFVAVNENQPVMVVWKRGTKQASTKKRMLTESAQTAHFNEKFQINTVLGTDENGTPSKKLSKLTVASDKAHGILGTADLDLSQFNDGDYRMHQIPLENCQYENAFIEVGLKGVE